jgi:hypothetical protein
MAENLTGKTLFHINSHASRSPHPLMKAGDALDVGKEMNPFFGYYDVKPFTYPVSEPDGLVNQVPAMRFLERVKDGSITPGSLPATAFEIADHFSMLARELLWESVRLSEFPQEPSRQKCIWLAESIPDVMQWLRRMHVRPVQVVEVRATGRRHIADQWQLVGGSEMLRVWYEKARAYWRGDRTPTPDLEILFEGRIEVVRIVDPAEYSEIATQR